MRRQRLTWQQRGGAVRRASAHPAYPDEGPASPAYKADPEADAYENGDPSSWAEDPHPGPYPNSAHPATPDEGPASPAYKAAALTIALEKKAAKCLRLASALMGPGASEYAVENQALSLMDLSDRALAASLRRFKAGEDEVEVEDDDTEEVEHHEEEAMKMASSKKARTVKALLRLLAEEEMDAGEFVDEGSVHSGESMDEMLAEMLSEEGMGDSGEMLDEMLAEEGMGHGESMDEMLAEMLSEEGMGDSGEMLDEMLAEEGMAAEHEDAAPAEAAFEGEADMDPMGVMGDESMMLASLFGKNAEEEPAEEAEEDPAEEPKMASRKASLRPQPKKPSTGATRLGGGVISKTASEVNELSSLWESAPDVSKFF